MSSSSRTLLTVNTLEDRVVLTAQALPGEYYAVGAEAGDAPIVTVYDATTNEEAFAFEAYDKTMTAGVEVDLADFNGDGVADIITAPGEGGAPHVRIFDGVTSTEIATDLGNFFAGDPAAREGADLTTTDFTGDGLDDLFAIVPTEAGITYKLFNGATGQQEAAAVGRILTDSGDAILAIQALIPASDTAHENADNPSQHMIYIYDPYVIPQQPIWDERIREMTPEERANAVALYQAPGPQPAPVDAAKKEVTDQLKKLADAHKNNKFDPANIEEMIAAGAAIRNGNLVYFHDVLPGGNVQFVVLELVPPSAVIERRRLPYGDFDDVIVSTTPAYYRVIQIGVTAADVHDFNGATHLERIQEYRRLNQANRINELIQGGGQVVIDLIPGVNALDKFLRDDTTTLDVVWAVLEDGSTVLTLGTAGAAIKGVTVTNRLRRAGQAAAGLDIVLGGRSVVNGIDMLESDPNAGAVHITEGLIRIALGVGGIKALGKVVEPFTIRDSKWDYFFGRVTSNPHNTQRSLQNLRDLESLGIKESEGGRAKLMQIFRDGISAPEVKRFNVPGGITIVRLVKIEGKGYIEVNYFYAGGDFTLVPEVTSLIPKPSR